MQNVDYLSVTSNHTIQLDRRHFGVELALIFLAFVALFVHSIPSIYIELLVLIYVIIRCNLYENVFNFMVFLPDIAGYVFNPLGINHVGGALKYLGLGVLLGMMVIRKVKMNQLLKGLVPLLFFFLLLFFSVISTYGGTHAMPKLISTIRHGLIGFFAYSFLFSNKERFDFTKMGMLFIVLAVFLVPMSIRVNGISGPSNLFDFGFMRYQTHEDFFGSGEGGSFHINYQGTGFLLLIGFGFYMIESQKNRLLHVLLMLSIIMVFLLYIGSRQAIISGLVMILVWGLFLYRDEVSKRQNKTLKRLLVIALIVGILYNVVGMLISEDGILFSLAEKGYVEGAGRGMWLMAGVEQFLANPVWGVGYGRYMLWGQYGSYPHNLFIELLCETGLIGFSIVMMLGIPAAVRSRKVSMEFLLLWLACFLRSMVSGDISLNIIVFAILFALSSIKKKTSNLNM